MPTHPMRLLDLFAHWRDQRLYDLQAVITHLRSRAPLNAEAVEERQIATLRFYIDDQGRPAAIRHETSLTDVLARHIGLTGTLRIKTATLLPALRLERERCLRSLLRTAQADLAQLLDTVEVKALRDLPMFKQGPSDSVSAFLRLASENQKAHALREYPATLLARALSSDAAQTLLDEIEHTLGWQTPPSGAGALSVHDLAMLTLVLPWALDPDEDFLGFDFYEQQAGIAVGQLLDKLQTHAISKLNDCPAATFGLIRYLLNRHGPAELSVLGLPDSLAWASSLTWVQLSHGVTILEVCKPGITGECYFNEALELPARLAQLDDSERMAEALVAVLAPGLARWNTATQRIAGLPMPLTPVGAAQTFFKHVEAVDQAASALQAPMPDRLQMIEDELKARGISPEARFVEATKRREESLKRSGGITAVQALASGLAAGDNPVFVQALVSVGNGLYEPWSNTRNLPNMTSRFEEAFTRWKQEAAQAASSMTQRLLADLPLEDRLRLESHPVTLCKLARRGARDDKAQVSSYGMVAYVHTSSGAYFYALLPSTAWCHVVADTQRKLAPPRGRSQAREERLLPFDWEAFTTGGLPAPKAQFSGWLEPFAYIPAAPDHAYQVFDNSKAISTHLQGLIEETLAALHPLARGVVPGEEPVEIPETLKALVPFWSSFETLKEGFEDGRGWLIAVGLLGFGLELLSFGAFARLSALSLRFVTLAMRQGTRRAIKLLGPRLRGAARDALDAVIPVGADPQAPAPVADLGLILSVRSGYGALLSGAARQLRALAGTQRLASLPLPASARRPAIFTQRLENDHQVLVINTGKSLPGLSLSRLVNHQTHLPYGPTLDVMDDAGRLGRLPKALPVTSVEGHPYLPDPAPSLPLTWIRWGEETWMECSGRFYQLSRGTAGQPKALEQAPSPFARPPLKRRGCRTRRTPIQVPLVCGPSGERLTRPFTELASNTEVPIGPVKWFDERKVIPDPTTNRFADNRKIWHTQHSRDEAVQELQWEDYKDEIQVRPIVGNELFQRIEITTGLVAQVNDRRLLSAVQVRATEDNALHMVTCADEGIFYHGVIAEQGETFTLRKMREGNSPQGNAMTIEEELKFLFNGCWDANFHIRNVGQAVVNKQLADIEHFLERGIRVEELLSQRFRLPTTPAQAALFAKYPRRSFVQQARTLIASDYTHPLSRQTPFDVRQAVAIHLNRLTDNATRFNAETVLESSKILKAPPHGRNIAFLMLRYSDGRADEVYYSVSGKTRDFALSKKTENRVWTAADGTRYVNCLGKADNMGADILIYLPDLSQANKHNAADINDRRLDSERNILAGLLDSQVALKDVTQATLFTRYPTCDSCTTLIAKFSEQFPQGRFQLYQGPAPAPAGPVPGP